MTDYEYVVWDNRDDSVHRGPWPEQECIDWVEECYEIFPKAGKAGIDKIWSVRRRPVGEWETYE